MPKRARRKCMSLRKLCTNWRRMPRMTDKEKIAELEEKLKKADELNSQQYTLILQLSEQLRAYEVLTKVKRI
jgi:hypothetical protein